MKILMINSPYVKIFLAKCLTQKTHKAEIWLSKFQRWIIIGKSINGITFNSNDKFSNSKKFDEKKSDGKKSVDKKVT